MTIHDGTSERFVQACTGEGKTRRDLMAMFGMDANKVSNTLKLLVKIGRVRKTEGPAGTDRWRCIFVATGVPSKSLPKMTEEERKARKAERRREADRAKNPQKAAKLPAWSAPRGVPLTVAKRCDLPPVITEKTKFTRCPSGTDYRFAVDPSIAGRGVISQDYFARRQQKAA